MDYRLSSFLFMTGLFVVLLPFGLSDLQFVCVMVGVGLMCAGVAEVLRGPER